LISICTAKGQRGGDVEAGRGQGEAEAHIRAAAGLGLKEEALTRNDALRTQVWSKH
jgi:hypothetical protein